MKPKFTAIFFDFDGTIADTVNGILATMTATFKELNLPIPPQQDMRSTIGMLLGDALQQLGNLDDEQRVLAVKTYQRLFREVELPNTRIFPGVASTLQQLQSAGVKMAIVTSRGIESLRLILTQNGILDFFDELVTRDNGFKPKPAPDMVNYLLQKLNLAPQEVLVVGDTTFDIDMGNAAGCNTCAVTYGNHTAECLSQSGCNYMVGSFEEIIGVAV
ncbi:MAG: HAD family hydrolase [Bacteroidales bacterium]|nr:HAD family hydrolase [Bacteroidales bacterium]